MRIDDCSFIIKSFLRPQCLARLLLSIHRHYPGTPTIVVDDSGNNDAASVCAPYPYVTLIRTLDKDVGSSRGRNIGMQQVATKYFVTLDDDFVLCSATNFEEMRLRLEENGADIVCGTCMEPEEGVIRQSAMGFIEHSGNHLLMRLELAPGAEGWVKASNCFFLAKTSLRETLGWPDEIKTSEHGPFFWLAHKMGCKVWASVASSVVHFRDRDPEYARFRNRVNTRGDQDVVRACDEFRRRHHFVWQTRQLFEEFGEAFTPGTFGWPRFVPPTTETQQRLTDLLHAKSP